MSLTLENISYKGKKTVKKISHILGVADENHIPIMFEGYEHWYSFQHMLRNICTFGKYKKKLNENFLEKAYNFLKSSLFGNSEIKNKNKKFAENLYYCKKVNYIYSNPHDSISNNSFNNRFNIPIAFTCGSDHHSIGLSVFRNFIIYTNTGEGSGSSPGTFIFEVDKEKIKNFPTILNRISNTREEGVNGSQDMNTFCNHMSEILDRDQIAAIKSPTKDYSSSNEYKTFAYIPCKKQKRGDCAQTNNKKNIKGLLVILHLLYHEKQVSLNSITNIVKDHFQTESKNNPNSLDYFYKEITGGNRKEFITTLVEQINNDAFYERDRMLIELTLALYIIQHLKQDKEKHVINEISKCKKESWDNIKSIIWVDYLQKHMGDRFSATSRLKQVLEIANDKSPAFIPDLKYVEKLASKQMYDIPVYRKYLKEVTPKAILN